ncbi:EAL domain-containing protein [Arcobacter sp. YIC-310]|uniref:EAL domain-containing protein n=1 Tax=Arcobacter sp. YIC-310 TaxID=3376632 RepID=UPI003C1BED35
MENNFKKVLKHYQFNESDSKELMKIKDIALKYIDELLLGFYDFIFKFDHARMFLNNKEIQKRHEVGIKNWYLSLFCGNYDAFYFEKLNYISEVHVKIGLPTHYVNAAFSYIRRFMKDVLIKEKMFNSLNSLDKIIDINLDILTVVYKEEEQSKLVDEILFLKNAVDEGNIVPYFQAIFNSKTLKIEKYESLMRIKTKDNSEVVSIFKYLDLSKKINLYEKMMYLMFEKSFDVFCNKGFEFSLNLCYEDIQNESFRNFIYEKVRRCKNSNYIIFEILESDCIKDFSVVQEFIYTIRAFGCKIAIDDFGSGYSSMENILKLKPDIIKIDGSLIKDINTSLESKKIVKNIVRMAKDLKAYTVAEYVHSKEVFNIVVDLEVDFLQGFYLAKPQRFIKQNNEKNL